MAIPAPRSTWTDSENEIPHAVDLNAEWRDVLNLMVGTTRPGFSGRNNVNTAIANNTWVAIPWNVEQTKRLVTHSANSAIITVPEAGWYAGVAKMSWSTAGNVVGRRRIDIRVNSVLQNMQMDSTPLFVDNFRSDVAPFEVLLAANDQVEMCVFHDSGSAILTSSGGQVSIEFHPYFEIWWDGKD